MQTKRQGGFTFLEVLVSASILFIAVAAIVSFSAYLSKTRRKARLIDVAHTIAEDIENKLRSPSNLLFSLSDYSINQKLAQCTLGIVSARNANGVPIAGGCKGMTTQAKTTRFALLIPNTGQNTAGNLIQASSSASSPRYYDTHGKYCNLVSKTSVPNSGSVTYSYNDDCAFQVDTYFYADCQGDSKCFGGATDLYLGYAVYARPGSLSYLPQISGTVSMYNQAIKYNAFFPIFPKMQRYFPMSVAQVLGTNKYSQCYFGSVIAGFDARGRAICKCQAPQVETGTQAVYGVLNNLISPVCNLSNKQECASGQYFRGYNPDGTAICSTGSKAFSCTTIPGTLGGTHSPCPSGYYVSAVQSVCSATCQYDPKGSNQCDTTTPGVVQNSNGYSHGVTCYNATLVCCQGASN